MTGRASSYAWWPVLVAPALYVPASIIGFRWYFVAIAATLLVALDAMGRISRNVVLGDLGFPLFLWIGVNVGSSIWAADQYVALLYSLYVAVLAIFWLGGAAFLSRCGAYTASGIFAIAVVLILLVFAYVLMEFGTIRPTTDAVARVFGAGANAGAVHAVVALPFLFWRCSTHRSSANYFFVLVAVTVIVVAQSRAAYLATFLVALLWSFGRAQRRSMTSRVLKASAGAAVLVFTVVVFAPQTVTRLLNVVLAFTDPSLLLAEGQGDLSRIATYYFGWMAFQDNVLLGIGFHNLQGYMESQIGFGDGSHNLLITLFAETGVPGALTFALLLYRFFRRVRAAIVHAKDSHAADWWMSVRTAMVATLVVSMFHQLPEFQFFYLLLGFACVPHPSFWRPERSVRVSMHSDTEARAQ